MWFMWGHGHAQQVPLVLPCYCVLLCVVAFLVNTTGSSMHCVAWCVMLWRAGDRAGLGVGAHITLALDALVRHCWGKVRGGGRGCLILSAWLPSVSLLGFFDVSVFLFVVSVGSCPSVPVPPNTLHPPQPQTSLHLHLPPLPAPSPPSPCLHSSLSPDSLFPPSPQIASSLSNDESETGATSLFSWLWSHPVVTSPQRDMRGVVMRLLRVLPEAWLRQQRRRAAMMTAARGRGAEGAGGELLGGWGWGKWEGGGQEGFGGLGCVCGG